MDVSATQHQLSFRGGLLRIALGAGIFAFVPAFVPAAEAYRWLLGLYVAIAAGVQLLIWKEKAADARALLMGTADMFMLTFLIHRLGSQTSAFVSLYVFTGLVYAIVLRRAIALPLAILGAGAYAGVVLAEQLGWLPYAPDAPQWLRRPPSESGALASAALVALIVVGAALIVGDLTRLLRDREQQLEQLSRSDPLTRLSNRRSLLERLDVELARVRRGRPLALLMIDLDGFKHINDRFGHLRGDECLVEIAGGLRRCTRETDVVSRYGGDEFAVLLPDADPTSARQIGGRLVETLRGIGTAFEAECPVTASVGLALARAEDDPSTLLRRADENTYRAKRDGGDRLAEDG